MKHCYNYLKFCGRKQETHTHIYNVLGNVFARKGFCSDIYVDVINTNEITDSFVFFSLKKIIIQSYYKRSVCFFEITVNLILILLVYKSVTLLHFCFLCM